MLIGACRVKLYLPGCASLKEKRGRLKPLLARLPKEFNVAVAEVGLNDVWQSAEIALVTVANGDAGFLHSELQTMTRWIEQHFGGDVEVEDAQIELR
jgi:uncharacterized protein YlxP (DUF503 family)